MKMRKILAASLMVAMLATAFVGCGTKDSTTSDSSSSASSAAASTVTEKTAFQKEIDKGPVELTYYQVGDPAPDAPKVWDEVNKLLKKDINATVKMLALNWSDYTTKYPLIFNSGEDFDAAYAATWLSYTDIAAKNGFYELKDDFIKDYAPLTAPKFFGDFKASDKGSMVNGKRYWLGQTSTDVDVMVSMVRSDIAEKYKVDVASLKTFDDLYTYIKAVGTNEKGMTALWDVGSGLQDAARWFQGWTVAKGWGIVGSLNRRALSIDPKTNKVFSPVATADYLDYAKKQDELQKLGCISKSANSNKTTTQDAFIANKTPIQILGIGSAGTQYLKTLGQNPNFKMSFIDYSNNDLGKPIAFAGYSVHATSKHPERTLMMLDLFHSKKEYSDLLAFGIPGVHYEAVGDNKYKSLGDSAKTFSAKGNCPWGVLDTALDRDSVELPDSYISLKQKFNTRVKGLSTDGFVLDESNIKSEIAAINSACTVYGPLIDTGLTGGYEKKVAEF